MATYRTTYPGNTALQEEVWDIPIAEAKATLGFLPTHKGSYWDTTLAKPLRRAMRAKAATVRVYTAHFSTSELSNAFFNANVTVTKAA